MDASPQLSGRNSLKAGSNELQQINHTFLHMVNLFFLDPYSGSIKSLLQGEWRMRKSEDIEEVA